MNLAQRLYTSIYRRALWAVRPLDGGGPKSHCALSIEIRELDRSELSAYAALRADQPLQKIRDRLDAGHQCIVAWHSGKIVHTCWLATNRVYIPYLHRDLIPPSGAYYGYDSFTAESHRGQDVATARSQFIAAYMHERGFREATAVIALENKSAVRGAQKAELQIKGMFHCLRIGIDSYVWAQPFGDAALPKLEHHLAATAG